ncbi:MAG: TonB-dependent receptor [Chthoniobacteraceae bacterium]
MRRSPLALACLSILTAARAETPAQSMRRSILDETIVTATRTENPVFATPYTAHVIVRDDFLGRRFVRTLPDALLETPGVMVQRTGYGQASPFIRGFTGFRTLALIDGIRLNNAVFREGPNQYWSTIDLFTVDRLDVVKGPSSVLHGSDAIGGTVNAISRKPPLISRPGRNIDAASPKAGAPETHGATHYRYSTAENSHTTRGELSLALSPQLGIAGGVTVKDFDDLRAGRGTGKQEFSGYSEISGDFSVLWRPDEKTDVTLAFQRFEQNNAPRWHSTIYSRSWEGTEIGTDRRRDFDQLRELAYMRIESRDIADWLSKASLTLSIHSQQEEQDRIRSNGRCDVDGFRDDQLGVLVNFESPSPVGLLSYGVEYYHDFVQSWGTSWNANGALRSIKPRGPVADDSGYDLLGIYVQDEIKIGDRLTLIPGMRWTWAQADTGVIDTDATDRLNLAGFTESFDAFTFSLRGQYDITRQWNVFSGISQGFRAPNLSDFTSFDIARSGEIETPVTDLAPEQYLSFEIGTKVSTGSFSLYAAFYRLWIDDQITRFRTGRVVDGSPEVKRINSGDGYVQGIEAGVTWMFAPGWSAFGNFTWSEGEVEQFDGNVIGTYPASRIQPLTAQLGLRWESPDAKWWAEGVATIAVRQDRLSLSDRTDTQRIPPGGTPGYATGSVRAGWRPCKDFDLYVACENFTDENYRIHGSGINEPGRNFVFGTRIGF